MAQNLMILNFVQYLKILRLSAYKKLASPSNTQVLEPTIIIVAITNMEGFVSWSGTIYRGELLKKNPKLKM